MRHKTVIGLFLLWVFPFTSAWAFDYRLITSQVLREKVKSECTLVHFWAAWCEICIQELPGLLGFLSKKRGVEQIVVDLSHSVAQEKFSKTWLRKIAPLSKTYKIGGARPKDLVKVVSPDWNGSLPLTVLISKGKLKQTWAGSVSQSELSEAFSRTCPAAH